ncbi:MAG: hypothetical protein KBG80_12080 [Breznakibacter sp.]|nr:hypothetical protein [Breznakibacter sp.]
MMEPVVANFGLDRGVKLRPLAQNHIGIVRLIKSRIIQKDAFKIVAIADTIRKHDLNLKVSLICHPNICSKSVALLKESDVELIYE